MSNDTTSWAQTDDGAELRRGDELCGVVTYRAADGWSAHRVGDGRRPRRFETFADAVVYVSTRAGHELTRADRQALCLPLPLGTPADSEALTPADAGRVSLSIPGRGYYSCRAETLTLMMSEHLPTSATALRAWCAERAGTELSAWDSVDLGAMLIILGDWHDATEANERESHRTTSADDEAPAQPRCDSTRGFRVFAPERVYVQCQACDATFPDPDNVGSLPRHETVRLFGAGAPSVTDDKRTMADAGWRFVSGRVLEDSEGKRFEVRMSTELAAWAARAIDDGTVSRDLGGAIVRLAFRFATAR